MMKRTLTCIICPRGCTLTADIAGENVTVTGHTCPKGEEYAVNEILHPMRTVTATIRVSNRENTMVSVKTQQAVPKDRMMNVMEALRKISVAAPISIGQVLLQDVEGSNIIATKNID